MLSRLQRPLLSLKLKSGIFKNLRGCQFPDFEYNDDEYFGKINKQTSQFGVEFPFAVWWHWVFKNDFTLVLNCNFGIIVDPEKKPMND